MSTTVPRFASTQPQEVIRQRTLFDPKWVLTSAIVLLTVVILLESMSDEVYFLTVEEVVLGQ
jgi:hypothetical protein